MNDLRVVTHQQRTSVTILVTITLPLRHRIITMGERIRDRGELTMLVLAILSVIVLVWGYWTA
ncbi:MAG TPA: hypothetical protein PK735_05465 [Flavobacteriales bacterium]|nr:hypothetical protein [Flavobacteriales bacterium]